MTEDVRGAVFAGIFSDYVQESGIGNSEGKVIKSTEGRDEVVMSIER